MSLSWPQWAVMGVYVAYLTPYVAISYYERYAVPLLGVKVLLMVWGGPRLVALAGSFTTKTISYETVEPGKHFLSRRHQRGAAVFAIFS